MILRIVTSLYTSSPAAFPTEWPIAQAVARLRDVTTDSLLGGVFKEAVIGEVSEQMVSLSRATPGHSNSFASTFIGKFETEDGKVVLRGAFSMNPTGKIGLSIWFVCCLLGFAYGLVAMIGAPVAASIGRPLLSLALLVSGVAIGWIGKWSDASDQAYVSETISRALSTKEA